MDEQHDGDHPYADEIIAIIRKAQRDGVDVESDLRCRLRDIESEIEHIERTMNHDVTSKHSTCAAQTVFHRLQR